MPTPLDPLVEPPEDEELVLELELLLPEPLELGKPLLEPPPPSSELFPGLPP
jgi:hypothetical protein